MSLISSFAETFKVRRFGKTEFANGKAMDPKCKEFEMRGSIQPFQPDQDEKEEQLVRDKKAIKIYTDEALKNVDEKNKQKGDQIYFLGEWYEVQQTEAWRGAGFMRGIVHFKSVAWKVSP